MFKQNVFSIFAFNIIAISTAYSEIPNTPLFPPECYPKPVGSGTLPTIRMLHDDPNASIGSAWASVCATWWCKSYESQDGWRHYGVCARPDELRPVEWAMSLTNETAREEWNSHQWRDTTTAEWDMLLKMWEETQPAPRYFVTYSTSGGVTAPTYRRTKTGGKASLPNGAVRVWVRCNCKERVKSSALWCSVSGWSPDGNTENRLPLINEDGSGGAFARCKETDVLLEPQLPPPGPEPIKPLPPSPCGTANTPCPESAVTPVVTHCGPGSRVSCNNNQQ